MFLLAALVTIALPAAALTLAPLVLGPLHVVSGARHLAATQRSPRAFSAGLVASGALFAIAFAWLGSPWKQPDVARFELAVGLAWAILVLGAGARAGAHRARVGALAAVLAIYAACAWAAPLALLMMLTLAHNVVSIAIAFGVFERTRRRPLALAAVVAGLALVLVAAPHVAGAAAVTSALQIESPHAALAILYLQLCHYAVWLWTIPRAGALPARGSWGVLAVVASVLMIALAPWLGGLAAARGAYLAIAGFHVLAELCALAGIALHGDARRLQQALA